MYLFLFEMCMVSPVKCFPKLTNPGKVYVYNTTEWSPGHMSDNTNSDDCKAGVRFVYHEYDYRLNHMKSFYQLITSFEYPKKKYISLRKHFW